MNDELRATREVILHPVCDVACRVQHVHVHARPQLFSRTRGWVSLSPSILRFASSLTCESICRGADEFSEERGARMRLHLTHMGNKG